MKNSKGKGLIKNEVLNVIEEFAHASSLHGVKYMLRRNAEVKDRLIWTVSVLVCVMFAVSVGSYLWHRYRMVPTVIQVKDTHQPLYTFPFPTVTVCSGTRIKQGPARDILSRYLPADIPVKSKESVLLNIMSILSLLQYPNYNLMRPYMRTLESEQYLHEFVALNISDFMRQVMPSCEEVFHECYWHGSQFNCCQVFHRQRTEEGFCWSFNSLTARGTSHCPLSEVLENEGVVEEDDFSPPECQLRRNTGISTGSGLELMLRPRDPRDYIGYRAQRVVDGVSAGTGIYTSNMKGSTMAIGIGAEITTSSESIRNLAPDDRQCIFPDEERLHIHHVYTKSSCLTECRIKYIMLLCRCKLYFFKMNGLHVPDCNVLHLPCLAKNSEKFRFYRPPVGTPGVTDREMMDSLNCNCYPTCYDSVYDIKLERHIPKDPTNHTRHAYVDIYYHKTGFTRYQRTVVFEFHDLVVALGGVANLFLGFSLLSLVETVYWITRIFIVALAAKRIHKKIIQVHPIDYFE